MKHAVENDPHPWHTEFAELPQPHGFGSYQKDDSNNQKLNRNGSLVLEIDTLSTRAPEVAKPAV